MPLLAVAPLLAGETVTVPFCAAGDVMLAREVAVRMRKDGVSAPFEGISPLLKRHRLAFCHIDFTISKRGSPRETGFLFRCPPESAEGLLASGFNLFSLADNHINDYGPDALVDTREFFAGRGFPIAGAAANAWDAMSPALVTVDGLRIALLAFREKPFPAAKPREPQPAAPDSAQVKAAIAAARRAADVVIVSYHWGRDYRHELSSFQIRMARVCIDAGADLILGHGAHALQPIAKYRGKYIFYGLGNCVFDGEFPMTAESMLVSGRLSKGGISEVTLTPLFIRNCRPEPAVGTDYRSLADKIRKYCAGQDIRIIYGGSGLSVR